MSFFNKALASLGIGATKVNTRLSRSTFKAGETVDGVVVIKGGNVEQSVDTIYLTLFTNYSRTSNDRSYEDHAIIKHIKVAEPFVVMQDEIIEVKFSFILPLNSPVTTGQTAVWVKTGVDIKNAVDPSDEDSLTIGPSPFMSEILDSITSLGFSIRTAHCFEAPNRFRGKQDFIQEFEFEPLSGVFEGKLDELEVIFFAENDESYELLIEVDRKSSANDRFDSDESIVRMRVRKSEIAEFSLRFKQTIEQYS